MKQLAKVICGLLAALAVMQSAAVPAAALENIVTDEVLNVDSDGNLLPPGFTEITQETAATEATVATEPAEPEEKKISVETAEAEGEETFDEVPLYFQTDYPNDMYGSGNIASSGCSITCVAMVASYLTGHEYLPDELADYFGGRAENNIARLEYACDALQLPWKKTTNWHETLNELKEGKIAIVLMNSKSIFTASQHFIVLTGMTEDGKIMVHDPYKPNYEHWQLKNAFVNGFGEGDVCCGYSGGWVFDKEAMPEEPFIYIEEKVYVEPRYPDIELNWEEKTLLARMVWVEAQGESAEGQQAVAEVVLNRMMADNFPNTLKGVVYAEGQFRSTPLLEDAQPTQAQYEAVERALEGPYVLDEDVVFFATYPVNENVWGQIGGHIFCHQLEPSVPSAKEIA